MKKIIINEKKLKKRDIEEKEYKVRALLLTENNEILVANYGEVFLLPRWKKR